MALSELNAAIPEKLPVKFAYNELGHRFESVQSKRRMHQWLTEDMSKEQYEELERQHRALAAAPTPAAAGEESQPRMAT